MTIHPDNKLLETDRNGGIWWWCPGCKIQHRIMPSKISGTGARWTIEKINPLTISPSVLVTWQRGEDPVNTCHSFIKGGNIQFLADCTHNLNGQTVPMIGEIADNG